MKLKIYGLTALDVEAAVAHQNMQVAAGQIGGPPAPGDQIFQFTVNALGRLSDTKDFENIIIKSESPSTQAEQVQDPRSPGRRPHSCASRMSGGST